MRPDFHELSLWYVSCLLAAIGLTVPVVGLVWLLAHSQDPQRRRRARRVAFWAAAFVAGLAGSPIFNRFYDEYIFTWPASLFVAFQTTLIVISWTEGQPEPNRKKCRRVSRLTGILFLAVCAGYVLLCRKLSAPHEWVFLIGFLPAAPLAVPAARCFLDQSRPLREYTWAVVAFSLYFWACGGFLIWKTWSGC